MTTTTMTEGHTLHRARLYDLLTTLTGGIVRKLHRRLLEHAAIAPGERVLDVGCGPGRLTVAAARTAGQAGETLGIDASPEMIALATKKAAHEGSSAKFRQAAIEALPAPDQHFDVVLASLMIHHLPPDLQRRGVSEVLRVLKPGGRFVVVDFGADPRRGLGHLLCVMGLRRGAEHAEKLRALFTSAGFASVDVDLGSSRSFAFLTARKGP